VLSSLLICNVVSITAILNILGTAEYLWNLKKYRCLSPPTQDLLKKKNLWRWGLWIEFCFKSYKWFWPASKIKKHSTCKKISVFILGSFPFSYRIFRIFQLIVNLKHSRISRWLSSQNLNLCPPSKLSFKTSTSLLISC
jgi:hypothetical protein